MFFSGLYLEGKVLVASVERVNLKSKLLYLLGKFMLLPSHKLNMFLLRDSLLMQVEIIMVLLGCQVLKFLDSSLEKEYLLGELFSNVDILRVLRVNLRVQLHRLLVILLCQLSVVLVQPRDCLFPQLHLLLLLLQLL